MKKRVTMLIISIILLLPSINVYADELKQENKASISSRIDYYGQLDINEVYDLYDYNQETIVRHIPKNLANGMQIKEVILEVNDGKSYKTINLYNSISLTPNYTIEETNDAWILTINLGENINVRELEINYVLGKSLVLNGEAAWYERNIYDNNNNSIKISSIIYTPDSNSNIWLQGGKLDKDNTSEYYKKINVDYNESIKLIGNSQYKETYKENISDEKKIYSEDENKEKASYEYSSSKSNESEYVENELTAVIAVVILIIIIIIFISKLKTKVKGKPKSAIRNQKNKYNLNKIQANKMKGTKEEAMEFSENTIEFVENHEIKEELWKE